MDTFDDILDGFSQIEKVKALRVIERIQDLRGPSDYRDRDIISLICRNMMRKFKSAEKIIANPDYFTSRFNGRCPVIMARLRELNHMPLYFAGTRAGTDIGLLAYMVAMWDFSCRISVGEVSNRPY